MTRYLSIPDIATAMRSPYSSERAFQDLVLELAKRTGYRCYHTFDARRSQPGYPDLTLCRPGRLLFLELKAPKGRVTDEQTAWILDLQRAGAEAYVVRSTGDRTRDAAAIVELLARRPAKAAA